MFRFAEPQNFWLLFAAAAVLGLAFWAFFDQRKRLERLADAPKLAGLMPDFSKKKARRKAFLFVAGLAFLVVALAEPQFGKKTTTAKAQFADVAIAIDVSRSMLVEDVRPNRLERAKNFAQKLIDALEGERIGLIVFAGAAEWQMPFSFDRKGAKTTFLEPISTEMASIQGTQIGEVIELFQKSTSKTGGSRALILLTDGETHDEKAVDRAEEAAEKGIQIFAVGVGTAAGGPVPDGEGNDFSGYKMDEKGQPVVAKIDEKMLLELAEAGGGSAFLIDEGDAAISKIRAAINEGKKREAEARAYSDWAARFQWPAALALFFLIAEWAMSWRAGRGIFGF